jgi:hypothetical protein
MASKLVINPSSKKFLVFLHFFFISRFDCFDLAIAQLRGNFQSNLERAKWDNNHA